MPDKKITELTASSAVTPTDLVPMVDAGTSATQKITIADFDLSAGVGSTFTPSDASMWPKTIVRMGKDLDLVGGTTSGDADEFVLDVQGAVWSLTNSPANYAKSAIYARAFTADVLTGARTRDIIGVTAQGAISSLCSSGRAWGMGTYAIVTSGGDGILTGIEADVRNDASDQPDVDTTTSKYGVQIVSQGDNDATAAIKIEKSGTGQWHKGIWISTAALDRANSSDAILRYGQDFVINSSGQIGIGSVPPLADIHVKSTGNVTQFLESTGANKAVYQIMDATFNWTGLESWISASPQWFIGSRGATTGTLHFYLSSGYTERFALSSVATVLSSAIVVTAAGTPTSGGAGELGQIQWDTSYLYVHTSTSPHVWKRAALSTF